MDIRQLARIDLNLLIALQVLLEERNVSRAAERLFVTQPAMSKTLGRLREVFDDPMFIRSSHGVGPTPKALELERPLREVLESVGKLVAPSAFDPASYSGEFVIATHENVGTVIMGPLMELLAQEAPGIRLRTVTRIDKQLEQLGEGNLDFSIHLQHAHYDDDYDIVCLTQTKLVALVQCDHPLVGEIAEWEKLVAYPFIDFYIPNLDEIASFQRKALPGQGLAELEFTFDTDHLMTALEVVRHTNSILMVPSFITCNPLVRFSIAVLPLPEEGFTLDYVLMSHRRIAGSAPHQWLRHKIEAVVNNLELEGALEA
jgi:DNA-binding transcriptional LysR family regulator